jgi:hypothetical protein
MSEAFPRTPEEIAEDYFARRGGILRALTDGGFAEPLLMVRMLHHLGPLQLTRCAAAALLLQRLRNFIKHAIQRKRTSASTVRGDAVH